MKVIVLGYGSVGKRHCNNLKALGYHVIVADPHCVRPEPDGTVTLFYRDWRQMLADHADAGAAVIASPTEYHYEHMDALDDAQIPFYCEKPIVTVAQYTDFTKRILDCSLVLRCAIGHQYRWHAAMPQVRAWLAHADRYHAPLDRSALCFVARDSLLARYGPQVSEMMACHMFDTATWLLGPALQTFIETDGVTLTGCTVHAGGRVARYDCDMNSPGRTSTIGVGKKTVELTASNDMYLDALRGWLTWVGGGKQDERTATLQQGLRVMDIMSGIKHAEAAAIIV